MLELTFENRMKRVIISVFGSINHQLQRCPEKGIDKKLLVRAAHGFNSQFSNLFGFSIPVSFVWRII